MSFRDRIGSDPSCSDSRYWRFDRTSGLPIDYFRRRRGTDWAGLGDVVVVLTAVAVFVVMLFGWPNP